MSQRQREDRRVWLSAVGRFLEWAKTTPDGLLALTGDGATRLLEAYVDEFPGQSSGADRVISEVAAS